MEKDYKQVVDTISNARRFGRHPGVEVTEHMLKQFAQKGRDAYRSIPFIHVAGTNGKGSVCAFLSNILMEQGLSVGTFTSPHLMDFEERITVCGRQISKEDVTRLGNELLQMDFAMSPTMFDYCLVMSLLYFEEQQVDVMVIETGLGGRLDSTNAIGIPSVSVITKIGFDHMAILGDTLTRIAGEKAGILKTGTSLVIETQEPEVMSVFQKVVKEKQIGTVHVIEQEEIEKVQQLPLQLQGVHQWENAAAAIEAARLFVRNQFGQELKKQTVTEGLKKTTWPGRMQILSIEPFFMVDGAHNGHGVHALYESLCYLYPGEKFHFVMGVMADKDYETMIEELLPLALDFRTYAVDSSRALESDRLAACIEKKGVRASTVESIAQIFHSLDTKVKTICFGSLYFIGDVCAYKKRMK